MEEYSRDCPTCKKQILYKTKKGLSNAVLKNNNCRKCGGLSQNKKGVLKTNIPKIGDMFSYWTVVNNDIFEIRKGHWAIKCKCKCGKENYVRINALVKGLSKGCPCRAIDKNKEKRNYIGDISDTFWGRIKNSAKIRNLKFDISKEYCWDLFLKQEKKCALSNLDIIIEKSISRKKGQSNITASLDRINSNLGYIERNVQWVHKDVNYIKQDLEESYFKKLCKLITENE